MSAPSLPLWGQLLWLALSAAAGGGLVYATAGSTRLQRWSAGYAGELDGMLRRMLLPAHGSTILTAQVVFGLLATGAALALQVPLLLAVTAVIVATPRAILRHLHKRRRKQIEDKLDGFALALANATRATPSIGRALQMLRPSLTAPLDAEIEQVLREMKVGSSAEEALLTFSWRVDSPVLDALLSNVLIAQRVGGELPKVLETTAATLREMARLEGVLRSKTAQARTQMWVLCCLPLVMVIAFDAVKPGYFDPLTDSVIGMVLLAMAAGLWLGGILLARRILRVEL